MLNNIEALKLLVRQGPDNVKDASNSKVKKIFGYLTFLLILIATRVGSKPCVVSDSEWFEKGPDLSVCVFVC